MRFHIPGRTRPESHHPSAIDTSQEARVALAIGYAFPVTSDEIAETRRYRIQHTRIVCDVCVCLTRQSLRVVHNKLCWCSGELLSYQNTLLSSVLSAPRPRARSLGYPPARYMCCRLVSILPAFFSPRVPGIAGEEGLLKGPSGGDRRVLSRDSPVNTLPLTSSSVRSVLRGCCCPFCFTYSTRVSDSSVNRESVLLPAGCPSIRIVSGPFPICRALSPVEIPLHLRKSPLIGYLRGKRVVRQSGHLRRCGSWSQRQVSLVWPWMEMGMLGCLRCDTAVNPQSEHDGAGPSLLDFKAVTGVLMMQAAAYF